MEDVFLNLVQQLIQGEFNKGEFFALALQFMPILASKLLEWIKMFQKGPFKLLHLPGLKGKAIKWGLSMTLSALIAALSQYAAKAAGVAVPTLTSGIVIGTSDAMAYGIARPKFSTPSSAKRTG